MLEWQEEESGAVCVCFGDFETFLWTWMLWRDNNQKFSSEIVLRFTFFNTKKWFLFFYFLFMEELDPIVLTCTEDRNTDKVTVKQQQPKKKNLILRLILLANCYCTVVQIRLFKHFLIFELLMTPGSLCGSCITCKYKNLLSKIIAPTLWDNVLWLSTCSMSKHSNSMLKIIQQTIL